MAWGYSALKCYTTRSFLSGRNLKSHYKCRAASLKGSKQDIVAGQVIHVLVYMYMAYIMCVILITLVMANIPSSGSYGWVNNLVDPDRNEATCTQLHMCMNQNEVQVLLQYGSMRFFIGANGSYNPSKGAYIHLVVLLDKNNLLHIRFVSLQTTCSSLTL